MSGLPGSGALREILAAFSIQVETDALERAEGHINSLVGIVRAAGPVLAEGFAVGAITEFVHHTIEAGARADDLANRLGLDVVALQKFQLAAQLAGVDAEGAAHSLGFLNKAVGEAISGQGGSKEAAETFAKLGISLTNGVGGPARDVADILNDTADALAKLPNQQERAAYAVKLFSREGQRLLPLLSKGSAGLKEVAEEFDALGGGMSKDFVDKAKATDDTLQMIGFGLNSLRVRIVGGLLPAIAAGANKVKGWVKGLIEWVDHTNFLKTATIALGSFLALKFTNTLIRLLKIFGLLKPSILGTVKALLGFAAPLAIVGALYLAFDELYTLMNGGDTIIGDLLEKMGGKGAKTKFIDELKKAWKSLTDVWDTWKPEDKLNLAVTLMKGFTAAIVASIIGVKLLADTLVGFAKLSQSKFSGKEGLQDMARAWMAMGNAQLGDIKELGMIKGLFDHPAADVPKEPDTVMDYVPPPGTSSVLGPAYGRAVTIPKGAYGGVLGPQSMNTIKNTINVTVTAGKNPEETGRRVAQAAASELETQNYNTSIALGAT